MKIVIDPGHYGYDSGAVGPSGILERDITMKVSNKIATILKNAGQEIKLTREEGNTKIVKDLNSDLVTRVQFANSWPADLFISIHCNSFANSSANGMEVYTTPDKGESDILAQSVAYSMIEYFPNLKFRSDTSDNDLDKEANFYVIRKTGMPAILIELAFISNPLEEALLNSEDGQNRFAEAISKGILRYIGTDLPNNQNQTSNGSNSGELEIAIKTLKDQKIINSPDYWIQNAVKGKTVSGEYVAILIKNMAEFVLKN